MKKQNILLGLSVVCALALISSCAAGPNPAAHVPNGAGHIAGFWRGIWHGLITPATFVISLFTDRMHFYEVHNNGGWYNLGFLVGIVPPTRYIVTKLDRLTS
ncbi:MAG TPA: hypothetical protein VHE10_03865 [Candidatus Paceibacterota bacterium]|nr:hypothetical protein [Candidatus Paceibacterota bacterium]